MSNEKPSSSIYWLFVFLFCELDLAPFWNGLIFQAEVRFATGKHFPRVLSAEMVLAVDYNIPPGEECSHCFLLK